MPRGMLALKKTFIFDMDGVVYRDMEPIQSAIDAIKFLRTLGKKTIFMTNNATKTRESFAEKLENMGLPTPPSDIFTSAYIAAEALAKEYPNGKAYVVGEQGLKTAMKSQGFQIINEECPEIENMKNLPIDVVADFVISGMDTQVTYSKLRTAMMLVLKGAHYYASNDDANFPAPGTLWPGSGAIVAFLATALETPPRKVFGKPHIEATQSVLSALGTNAEDVVMIGDRLTTDILGGNRANITTVCVETGISARADLTKFPKEYHPTYFYPTLSEMINEHFCRGEN